VAKKLIGLLFYSVLLTQKTPYRAQKAQQRHRNAKTIAHF